MRRFTALATATLVGGALLVAVSSSAGAAPTVADAPGSFHAVAAKRIVDTRYGVGAPKAAVGPNGSINPTVTGGSTGVPTDAGAVQVTITTAPTVYGGITAWSGVGTRPGTTNVQFTTGHGESDSAVVQVAAGKIALYNASSGSTQIVVDVTGYWTAETPAAGEPGLLHTITPKRAVDTRYGVGVPKRPIPANQAVDASLAAAIPAGARAVAITITVAPVASGGLIIYPTGAARPTQVTQYLTAGRGLSTFAVIPVSSNRGLTIANYAAGTTAVVIDVSGYYVGDAPKQTGALGPLTPNRVLDKSGFAGLATATVRAGGAGGVPLTPGTVAMVMVSAISPTASGGVTIYSGAQLPGVTTVQYRAGENRSALAFVPVPASGLLNVYNASPKAERIIVDVVGYVAGSTPDIPTSRGSHYLNNLSVVTDAASQQVDVDRMKTLGGADASAPFVLLDLGAQSVTPDEFTTTRAGQLDAAHPGVTIALTGTSTTDPVRIRYTDLVPILTGYLQGYADGGGTGTIAIGTNNDGVYTGATGYAATTRGTDWWTKVVALLRNAAPSGVDVQGANDLEPGFAGTVTQAQQWEAAFLTDPAAKLVNNGSADGCSFSFGTTLTTCDRGWTTTAIYGLSHRSDGRVRALPQIYFPEQAVQWANIDAVGGKGLVFVGALSEPADTDNSADDGWTQLYRALSSVLTAPSVPLSVAIAAA